MFFRDNKLEPIWNKIQSGERLSAEDGKILFQTSDIISIGKMANYIQRYLNGDAAYFILNQKIEPTNLCVHSCKFCKFSRKRGAGDIYEMTIEQIISKLSPAIKEVHITGGLHPDWGLEYYIEILNQIKKHFPGIGIKAFTAVEIEYFSKKFDLSIEEILLRFKEAGLSMIPGGGAEVFSERIRNILFPQKISADEWINIHRLAHKMGIPSNATILYGHIETIEERLNHLIKLRELQDETNGFLSFIPLAFQPADTGITQTGGATSALDDLKMIAISRLMLDNFPHIKAYWVTLTENLASVALSFGADDIEGTIGGERIVHDAGAESANFLKKEKIIKIIESADKIPVERDIFYNPLNIHKENVIGKIPYLNSVPFYENLISKYFKILPITPRRMGILSKKDELVAGLFSLVDFIEQKDTLELIDYCLATRDQVKSVLLFSNYGWKELDGKRIGIIDATSTSVILLKILLEKRYYIKNVIFERMHPCVGNYDMYDAVLLIGDEALKHKKYGLAGFEIVYDLATEWYNWKNLPFVFAVWAVKKSLSGEIKKELIDVINKSLEYAEEDFSVIGRIHSKKIELTNKERVDYLSGFNYRLGVREKESITEFERYILEIKKYEQV